MLAGCQLSFHLKRIATGCDSNKCVVPAAVCPCKNSDYVKFVVMNVGTEEEKSVQIKK